ncbi:MAG: small subunit ribosomal protein S9 [Parcubacteria group bacterium Gr01-1014_29]|nr:MAG: small subunit ribosomal protein S9 [Parcubacteria group bacterium Gr01-1014_29]
MTTSAKKKQEKPEAYKQGTGRRKTAIARVRIFSAKGGSASGGEKGAGITVNDKEYHDYFATEPLAQIVLKALSVLQLDGKIKVTAHVSGGGIHAQAQAVRHGIARALVAHNPDYRKKLRDNNLLTRDPRMKERRKFGLKKARRAPQWSKR